VTAGPANGRRHPALSQMAWWWGPVLIYAALIFIASSIPQPPSLPQIVTDKDVHGGVYAGFALVVLRALARRWERVTLLTMAGAVVLAVLYGGSDEFHQSFVPGRTSDIADLRADAIGATVAVGLAGVISRFRGRVSDAKI
jgi:VanZ family protein